MGSPLLVVLVCCRDRSEGMVLAEVVTKSYTGVPTWYVKQRDILWLQGYTILVAEGEGQEVNATVVLHDFDPPPKKTKQNNTKQYKTSKQKKQDLAKPVLCSVLSLRWNGTLTIRCK